MKRLKRILLISIALISFVFLAFYLYTLDFYRADALALNVYQNETVEIIDDVHIFTSDSEQAIIFYPGGKVEVEAYAYLASLLQDQGITVFLVDMPFNLAVFNINAAAKIVETHPEIQEWFLMGHSLGGAMASAHLDKHADLYKGIIYLAAYPLNEVDLPSFILVGENDEVLDFDKLKEFSFQTIEGGNHAYFANYGDQDGDGKAQITRASQQAQTIDAILNFIK
jgi:predicted esterase